MATGLKQRLDYSDYALLPQDGRRWELLDGDILVTPAPAPRHQRVSKRLQRQLEAYFEAQGLGEVFDAPIDIILTPHDVLQPDLVVVTDAALVSERGIEGPPALVVEVLSPSSQAQDRGAKSRRYAALGVAHYWIVDPDGRTLECFRLSGSALEPVAEGRGDAEVADPAWPDLTVSLAPLWR